MKNIRDIEKIFSDNDYFKFDNSDYRIIDGSFPVVVSAPHCIKHIRNGSYKVADGFSGTNAIMLHESIDCFVIYNTNSDTDPNFDSQSNYKDALVQLIERENIVCLVDIHKSRSDRWFDMDLKIRNIDDVLKKAIEDVFLKHGYDKISYNFFSNSKSIVAHDVAARTSIPCIQLKINCKHSNPDIPETFDKLNQCLIDLCKLFV